MKQRKNFLKRCFMKFFLCFSCAFSKDFIGKTGHFSIVLEHFFIKTKNFNEKIGFHSVFSPL
jgi:hypothetical protein